jgi:hypothetical protein
MPAASPGTWEPAIAAAVISADRTLSRGPRIPLRGPVFWERLQKAEGDASTGVEAEG